MRNRHILGYSSNYLVNKYVSPIPIVKKETEFIPIYQTGGIGDLIISLPFIDTFKNSTIPIRLYTNYPDIAKIFLKWPDIRANELPPEMKYKVISSDALDFQFLHADGEKALPPYLQPIYKIWMDLFPVWGELIKKHPHQGNQLARLAVSKGWARWNLPFLFIGKPYTPFKFDIQDIDQPKKFITVHDGFSDHHKISRSTKSWDIPYWEYLLFEFKRMHKDVVIIQLGNKPDTVLKGIDINLVGKLSFYDSLRYLKSSLLHIDTDSGLVHARRLFSKPSVVIFGPTNVNYFGYPENINLAPLECGDCWWLKGDWMRKCVKDFPSIMCMQSTKPERVLNEVNNYFKRNRL